MDKTQKEFVRGMEAACRLAKDTLDYIGAFVEAGVTPITLDKLCHEFTLSKGATSGPLGYHGFPYSICTSVNNMICHGLPDDTPLELGDIINIDVSPILHGYFGDSSRTFIVGKTSPEIEDLVKCAKDAMNAGISAIKPGARTGDIGNATEKLVKSRGFYVCKDIGGHGIGRVFHDDPFIPSFGRKGKGAKLIPWSCITVEPAVNQSKTPSIEHSIENSTITEIATENDCFSAQFEHTVLITDTGYEILTL